MAENTKNIIKCERGQFLFHKGQKMNQIALVVRGSVMATGEYFQIPLQAGEIIGIMDTESPEYLFDYVALESSAICMFEYTCPDDMGALGTAIKDYRNYIIRSVCSQLDKVTDLYMTLGGVTHKLVNYIREYYDSYIQLCDEYMKKPAVIPVIDELGVISDEDADEKTIKYFQTLSEMPEDVTKPFFNEDEDIMAYHVYMAATLVREMMNACDERYRIYSESFPLLFSKGTGNIFTLYSKLAIEVAGVGGNISKLMYDLDKIIALIRECKDMDEETLGVEFKYDFSRINDIYNAIKMKNKDDGNISDKEKEELLFTYSDSQVQEAVENTKDSLKKILGYSGIEQEKAEIFDKYLTVYKRLKDPFSTENDVRKLRSKITELFYEIYEKVFFKAEKEEHTDRIIEMFLDYGFMDEKLFDKNTLVALYYIKDDAESMTSGINVYTIRQWLHLIYIGEKEPSKNEFDMDYEENFRELKRTQKFTAEEEKKYFEDYEGKVKYEIANMFKVNNRLTNGQVSTFCPVLNGRDFINDVDNMFVSSIKVEDAMLSVTDVDFSAFYRDYLFEDEKNKISKLTLSKEVLPDVILMPNAGHKGSMWQEITGKRRDTPGRFIISAFTADNLRDIMIRLVGAFRWELCRTVQGTYWNDIREKSLTAEYCDYVQFYKKNRDLSDETKEKIKVQMQKCRNNTREMFIKDYELWIKNEAMGLTRVNKAVRFILAAYCPFAKKYRDKVAEHPMFKDSLARYERERLKKIKELNNRFVSIRNSGGTVTDEMEKNLQNLKEM